MFGLTRVVLRARRARVPGVGVVQGRRAGATRHHQPLNHQERKTGASTSRSCHRSPGVVARAKRGLRRSKWVTRHVPSASLGEVIYPRRILLP
jgi:hypothetical protein